MQPETPTGRDVIPPHAHIFDASVPSAAPALGPVFQAPHLQCGDLLTLEMGLGIFGELCLSESFHVNVREAWDTKPGALEFVPLAFSSTNLCVPQAGGPSRSQIGQFAN